LVELAQNIDNPTWKKEHESEKRLNLPKPVYCGGNKPNDMFCDLPPPRCATSFQPKVGMDIGQIMLNDTGREAMSARYKRAGDDYGWTSWTLQMSPADIPELYDHHARTVGYLDRKYVFMGYRRSGWVSFNLTGSKGGPLLVCDAETGWSKPDDNGTPVRDCDYKLDGRDISPVDSQKDGPMKETILRAERTGWSYQDDGPDLALAMAQASTCAFFTQDYPGGKHHGILTPGDHVLQMRVKEGTTKYISLAYVIWW